MVGAVVPRRPAARDPALHGRMRTGIGVRSEHGGYVLGAPGACKKAGIVGVIVVLLSAVLLASSVSSVLRGTELAFKKTFSKGSFAKSAGDDLVFFLD